MEFDKKKFEEVENDFFKDIDYNSDEIWAKIEQKKKKGIIIPLWFYSVAAALTIFFLLGLSGLYIIQEKNNQISELRSDMEIISKQKNKVEIKTHFIEKTDTVFITKNIVKYAQLPVYKINTIIKTDTVFNTIAKTIYKTDTVFNTITETIFDTIYIGKEDSKFIDSIHQNVNVDDDKYFAKLELEQENRLTNLRLKKRFSFLKLEIFGSKKSESLYSPNFFVVDLDRKNHK